MWKKMFTGKTFVWNSFVILWLSPPERPEETPGDVQFPVTWVYTTTVFPGGKLKFRDCYYIIAWM